jgi:transposase
MIATYRAGATLRQIAAQFGFHRDTVSAALEGEGVTRRFHQRVDVDLDQADELHAAGLSITEVAKAMGIGRTTLIKARRAARE